MDASFSSSSSSSSSKGFTETGEQPHVLAVDDSLIDRKLIEKLLKNSSCKGIYIYIYVICMSLLLSGFVLLYFPRRPKDSSPFTIDEEDLYLFFETLMVMDICIAVTTAENGPRALEVLGLGDHQHNKLESNASKVNMIITDYCMPGMTGYELLKKIKESSNLREVPVVIMSSENVPTRINKFVPFSQQVLGGRSSDVHFKASEPIGHKEIEMSFDELQELKIIVHLSHEAAKSVISC
ncbi:hypothetical protein FEM48_Zijuj03G0118400 [Ziziphus jujuba var. spinosa]|uniref:Response regulatory domain-containing protein n=1 Tax=Ziziphus jujuba var. spinosa TaxID=714518 RepID=A0A978VQ53_ZIZJJ|nr:hypothetical protein FEM48_Zijuj03G0118400 [Ziziphus jujuba var. spinosa]